jgi:hypothetical protein
MGTLLAAYRSVLRPDWAGDCPTSTRPGAEVGSFGRQLLATAADPSPESNLFHLFERPKRHSVNFPRAATNFSATTSSHKHLIFETSRACSCLRDHRASAVRLSPGNNNYSAVFLVGVSGHAAALGRVSLERRLELLQDRHTTPAGRATPGY